MELKDHIRSVESNPRGDWTHETVWSFKISDELYELVRTKMTTEVDRLYMKYMGDGTVQWSCPAMGEYTDDFAWVYYGDKEVPLNLYKKELGGYLEIIVKNEPEDKFDCLDPNHGHWICPPPSQWLMVLAMIKNLFSTMGVMKNAM